MKRKTGNTHEVDFVTGKSSFIAGTDYIATIRTGDGEQSINLGDTDFVSQHGLQLPEVGGHVVVNGLPVNAHSQYIRLPVTSVKTASRIQISLAACFSFLSSVALVAVCVAFWRISRWQAFLYRERKMIDRSLHTKT